MKTDYRIIWLVYVSKSEPPMAFRKHKSAQDFIEFMKEERGRKLKIEEFPMYYVED